MNSAHAAQDNDIKLRETPQAVGGYEIVKGGGFKFNFTAKPNWWYRLWTRLYLGWIWVNERKS